MNKLNIIVDVNANHAVDKILMEGIKRFNESKIGAYERKPFTIYIVNDNEDVIGGIKGDISDKVCGIQIAWVHENERKKGLGTKLFLKLEEFAKQNHCEFLQLDSTEFQARHFYERLGFSVIASLPDNFKGHTTFIMRKKID